VSPGYAGHKHDDVPMTRTSANTPPCKLYTGSAVSCGMTRRSGEY